MEHMDAARLEGNDTGNTGKPFINWVHIKYFLMSPHAYAKNHLIFYLIGINVLCSIVLTLTFSSYCLYNIILCLSGYNLYSIYYIGEYLYNIVCHQW